ncbi:MAG: hypothetical protein P4L46_14720 [Fimbriimonas sp.]|nr:hypothetical protein [Fimbriimonas sp.]
MSVVAVYLIACLCRATLPQLGWKLTTTLFAIRFAVSLAGLGLAEAFVWFFCAHGPHLIKNPNTAEDLLFFAFGLSVVAGELIARRQLRASNLFPKGKWLPLIY